MNQSNPVPQRTVLAQENSRLVEEIADLAYHVLVLMVAKGLTPAEVLAELEKRHK